MKVKKRIQQEYQILTKRNMLHIIQLFTKHKTNVKCGQMQIS